MEQILLAHLQEKFNSGDIPGFENVEVIQHGDGVIFLKCHEAKTWFMISYDCGGMLASDHNQIPYLCPDCGSGPETIKIINEKIWTEFQNSLERKDNEV